MYLYNVKYPFQSEQMLAKGLLDKGLVWGQQWNWLEISLSARTLVIPFFESKQLALEMLSHSVVKHT